MTAWPLDPDHGETHASQHEIHRPFIPAIRMDEDRRAAPAEFARRAGLALRDEVGATGLVRCGAATGTGQLTVRNDVITTAAHVLIDERGRRRTGCVFEPMIGSGAIPIDYGSISTGSDLPLSNRATRDWAVAKLVAPVPGARPYAVASSLALPSNILMCAGGNKGFAAMGMERCNARKVIGKSPDGIREIAIDCNAGPGSSGAALLSGKKVLGIYVGYRSDNPKKVQAFSESHYNFAITVEGPFRRALLAAGGQ
ncbi:MAG: hypothetical protein IT539_11045 [Bradyrhizobiaceae bacterium]|nr:hypothetical protein [Bradyrhizobiaceae bacterium]